MRRFVCEKNGEKVVLPCAYTHGYNFGDRVLEEVFFKVIVTKDNKLKCSVADGSVFYMTGLNKKYWLKLADEYVEREDIFQETEEGGEDVWLEDF
jgi:hypothetical protein